MTPDVSTTEQQLHAAATQMTGGLTDFGPQDYLPGLRALLDSMLRDMQFSEIGRQFGMGTIAGTLAARLHTEHGWKQRPDYRAVEIRRPLVITGIPRTGTTALHKLSLAGPAIPGSRALDHRSAAAAAAARDMGHSSGLSGLGRGTRNVLQDHAGDAARARHRGRRSRRVPRGAAAELRQQPVRVRHARALVRALVSHAGRGAFVPALRRRAAARRCRCTRAALAAEEPRARRADGSSARGAARCVRDPDTS